MSKHRALHYCHQDGMQITYHFGHMFWWSKLLYQGKTLTTPLKFPTWGQSVSIVISPKPPYFTYREAKSFPDLESCNWGYSWDIAMVNSHKRWVIPPITMVNVTSYAAGCVGIACELARVMGMRSATANRVQLTMVTCCTWRASFPWHWRSEVSMCRSMGLPEKPW